jgi:acyl-CoA synthetase (AMP-forming)/AMP-acid ligase II
MPGESRTASRYQHPLLPLELQQEYRDRGDWEGVTLAQIVEEWATRDPKRRAVIGPEPLTYGELWEQARRVAGALQDAGLRPGEFLVAVMSNCTEGLVLEVGASIAAAVFAPRSPHLSPAGAVSLFDQLDARGLILEGRLIAKEGWPEALAELRGRLSDRPVWRHGDASDGEESDSLPTLAHAIARGRPASPAEQDPGQPCLILSTGGTTGLPKSIVHSSETLVYAARRFGAAVGFTEADVHVAFAPYGHAGGSVFEMYMPLLHGASILPVARWRPREVAETIERYGGTFFIAMGTHLYDLLALEPSPAPQLRSMRLVSTGAGPEELFVNADRDLFRVARVYGCSEAPGHALGRLDDRPEIRLHQDGIPFDGMEWRIVDSEGDRVAPGTIGEYQCRGPNMFMGYYGQDDLTAKALTADGFYRSGDLMAESDAGYVSWTGRTKDIIRRGGLQIDPIEIEGMLSRHPQIATVAVVGQPDPRLGERAVIVAVPEDSDDPADLGGLCAYLEREGLPKQSLPERLVYVTDLPRTAVGKVHRVEVRRMITESAESAERSPA